MNYVVYPSSINQVTDKAFQCRIEDDLFWFPKSQTKAEARNVNGHKEYRVIIPAWLASKNGLFAKAFNGQNLYHIHETEEAI